jgi:hypothetical protein
MSNEWDDQNDDGQQSNQSQGGALRKQLEAALAANTTQSEELKKLKADVRRNAISKVLEKKNISEKVAKLVPAEVEPTAEAVEEWLKEYGDVFGVKTTEDANQDSAGDAGDEAGSVDEATRQAYIAQMRQMGNVTVGAAPTGKESELLQKINDPKMTYEGLVALIEQHGGGAGSG